MLRNVHLYGELANEFGGPYRLDVGSVAEAARALSVQLPGFRGAIASGQYQIFCGGGEAPDQALALDEANLTFALPVGDIHFLPVAAGAGDDGMSIAKIIGGIALSAVTMGMSGPAWLISMGASVALAGASSLLTPQEEDEKQPQSYMFSGAEQTAESGVCVPIVFGKCMVTPITISTGISTSNTTGLI